MEDIGEMKIAGQAVYDQLSSGIQEHLVSFTGTSEELDSFLDWEALILGEADIEVLKVFVLSGCQSGSTTVVAGISTDFVVGGVDKVVSAW